MHIPNTDVMYSVYNPTNSKDDVLQLQRSIETVLTVLREYTLHTNVQQKSKASNVTSQAMKDSVFAQHVRARDHITLERLDMAKQYSTLLANSDKHQFYRVHIDASGRMFKWNLLTDPEAGALRTALYGDASPIDNGYTSHDDSF